MTPSKVTDGIYRISANGGEDLLFESMWPLPRGVSMNSYIVKGEECAIIGGVCGWDGVPETLFSQLETISVRLEDIRHVVLNHLEPDHTGWLEPFTRMHRDFTLYASPRGLEMAEAFYPLPVERRAVRTGDRLELGAGRSLEFYEMPNVHWPETIATWDRSTGTLFPCDLYSSFGAVGEAPCDDLLSEEDLHLFEEETVRYFANILATHSSSVERALRQLGALGPRIIAPAHGPVWRRDPRRIAALYERLSACGRGAAAAEVTVIWGSMYGMTERALQAVLEGIQAEGVPAHTFRVPHQHVSYILASAWRSTGIVIGSPVYEYRLFPPVAAAVDELGRKRVARKKAFRFGSYGWSTAGRDELSEIVQRYRMEWDFLEPVEFAGRPGSDVLETLRGRGRELARAAKEAARPSGAAPWGP